MQNTTFEMQPTRKPQSFNIEHIRKLMNNAGFLNPSIILETDLGISISRNKNIYSIKNTMELKTISTVVEGDIINLSTPNKGVQELLIDIENNDEPAYAEEMDYESFITHLKLSNTDYDSKKCIVKYLTYY